MTTRVVPDTAPAVKPLALACALALSAVSFSAVAQQETAPSTVVVTGARFAADPALAPIGATVISAEDIRRAGAADVNEAIRKIGGVYGRQSLDGSPDFGLDLRGFGSNSGQNLVVLVDGVRMNENELAGTVLSTIPVDTVERIEISRGGSSVLYGEGATGGVIQVFTKKAARRTRGSVNVGIGQFSQRDLRASVATSVENIALDAAVGQLKTDNYRANNAFDQDTFSGGLQLSFPNGRAGLRIESARQELRLPGSLTLAQFNANPRQASTPNDYGSLDSDRVTLSGEVKVAGIDLAAELSHRERKVTAAYEYSFSGMSGYSRTQYNSRQTQFSPRARYLSRFEGMLNEVVAGVDLTRWERNTTADWSAARAGQDAKAFYLRDEIRWNDAHNGRLALGARHEEFDKDYVDPLGMTTKPEASSQSVNAWDLQGSYDVFAGVKLHAKAGQSYRLPNVDENSFRATTAVLDPQVSHDLELGATFGGAASNVAVRVFRHKLKNEIFYDPTANGFGANVNLDPTRRQGVELDGQLSLSPAWRVTGHVQHVDAKFTGGPNNGRQMVLVPRNVVTARLAWLPGDGQTADIGAQWVSNQRYGNDFANSCAARIPSYATVDARYARSFGPWEFSLSGLNLADKRYFSHAFGCRSGIYPSDGRQLKASLRYDF